MLLPVLSFCGISLLLQADGSEPMHRMVVQSEARVEEKEAIEEARGRLFEKLESLMSSKLNHAILDKEMKCRLPRLLNLPGIRVRERLETIDKPYGILYRKHLEVEIPTDVWLIRKNLQHNIGRTVPSRAKGFLTFF
jgi:hypothetical protein